MRRFLTCVSLLGIFIKSITFYLQRKSNVFCQKLSVFSCIVIQHYLLYQHGSPRKPQYPLTNDTYGDPVKVVTIPLPVIASSPNEGITYGALGAFLLHNSKDEVGTLLAPQINKNQNFGITTTLYGAFYPSPDRNWEMNLSKSTKVNQDYEFKIRDNTFLDKKLELNTYLSFSPTVRPVFSAFSPIAPQTTRPTMPMKKPDSTSPRGINSPTMYNWYSENVSRL